MNEKFCPRCQTTKPSDAFHAKGSGLAGWCKSCQSAYHRTWYQQHKTAPKRARPNLTCPKCCRTLTRDDFYWRRDGTRGSYCKPCTAVHVKAWYQVNPEKRRAIWQRRDAKAKARQFQRLLEGK